MKKADPILRAIKHPDSYGLLSKLFEWTVNDVMKAISAQQEAAFTEVIKRIYRKFNDSVSRKQLTKQLQTKDWIFNPWLHRQVRKVYKRGHTYVRNQIVYQNQGYSCERINRHQVKLEVQGLAKGKRIALVVKSNRIIKGQIRLIEKDGLLEIHAFVAVGENKEKPENYAQVIGVDKGYTEAFIDSEGKVYGKELGQKLTAKTERIHQKTETNKNFMPFTGKMKARTLRKPQ